MDKRRNFTPEQKAKIVIEVLREEKTLTEIAAAYEVHLNQLSRWKAEFLSNAPRAFNKETDEVEKVKQSYEKEKDELLRQIGQLSYENAWLKKNLVDSKSREDRFSLIDKSDKKLSMVKQANLLGVNRTSFYYKPVPISDEKYDIKRIIDEVYTAHPEYGYRRMTVILNRGYWILINRKRTRRYMREMGIYGFCPGPNLSKRLRGKYVYPCLLRCLEIDRPNQVWSIDITYCRMNCDQGSQFTSDDYINVLKENSIKISMDGKGRALDNQRIERFFRSYKWEKLYLEEYETGHQLRKMTQEYIEHYNNKRSHQSLDYKTPADRYYGLSTNMSAAV